MTYLRQLDFACTQEPSNDWDVLGVAASGGDLPLAVGKGYCGVGERLANLLLSVSGSDGAMGGHRRLVLLSQIAVPLSKSPGRPPGAR